MAKKRYINTKFWSDDFIIKLKPLERYFFLYLLTNEHTDICGIYELSEKVIERETDLDSKTIHKIFRLLKPKIDYLNGWVFIRNFEKHQAVNPKVAEGIKRSKESVPKEILANFSKNDIAYDSLSKTTKGYELLTPTLTLSPTPDISVANATVIFKNSTMPLEEITYEPIEGSAKKTKYGSKVMFMFVRAYLEACGIQLEQGEVYDANKIGKGISKLYKQLGDPDKTIEAIKLGGEYFKSKKLDWTPEAVWRNWEKIREWNNLNNNDIRYQ
jgi:hypothetical protein